MKHTCRNCGLNKKALSWCDWARDQVMFDAGDCHCWRPCSRLLPRILARILTVIALALIGLALVVGACLAWGVI